jgi:hypothetical protein
VELLLVVNIKWRSGCVAPTSFGGFGAILTFLAFFFKALNSGNPSESCALGTDNSFRAAPMKKLLGLSSPEEARRQDTPVQNI